MLPCLTEPKTYGFKRIDLKPRYKAVQYPAGRVPTAGGIAVKWRAWHGSRRTADSQSSGTPT